MPFRTATVTFVLMRSLAVMILCFSLAPRGGEAGITLVENRDGDHFVYHPSGGVDIENLLVIAHGSRNLDERAAETARRFLHRWTGFADAHGLALIVPVFDDDRFGNWKGGCGGYRGLFGREIGADKFVLGLVRTQRRVLGLPQKPFLLYGHSAGGSLLSGSLSGIPT